MEKEKNSGGRWLLDLVKGILGKEEVNPEEFPRELPETTVKKLIDKACGADPEEAGEAGNEKTEKTEKSESCPYATKRAIVESLAEIRRFAEEHQLAATVVRALLSLLAEMAVGALRGRVSGKVLDLLLKAIRYDRARMEAYAEGETAGRNARIRMEIFPAQERELPDINGPIHTPPAPASIFDIARGE